MVFNLRTPKPVPVVLPASGEAEDEVAEQREDINTMLFRAAQAAFEKLRPYKNTGDRADHAIFNELVDELIVEIVEGELLLACSFCNEAWHDAKECIGTMHPVPADEEEWACPSCIAEATARLDRKRQR